MYYYLMRKNTPITVVEIDESGQLIWADYAGVSDERLLPLEHATDKNRLSFGGNTGLLQSSKKKFMQC